MQISRDVFILSHFKSFRPSLFLANIFLTLRLLVLLRRLLPFKEIDML